MSPTSEAPEKRCLVLTPAAGKLVWQDWGDVFIVYQPSSAETHVFNETTFFFLEALKQGRLPPEGLRKKIAECLGVGIDEPALGDLDFAASRLEELGLVEWMGGPAAGQ